MKLRTAAVWALVGMLGSSAAAMAVPMSGRRAAGPSVATEAAGSPSAKAATEAVQTRFHADKTLAFDARLGHASVAKDGSGETFLLASIAGAERPDRVAAPMNLAIVIDRSGSMRGARLANAVSAATGIVERMRDGDRVTVVAFDDAAQVVVPPTLASVSSRPRIEADIRSIRPSGDTCISCGLEAAMRALQNARVAGDEVDRTILLSDGAANRGVRDADGLRAIAGRMRDRGCAVTTIGLDVDFDERVMAAIATESNGHHYFVADAGDLAQVFDQELDSLLATVARDAELVVEPAPGVEVVEVFDRAFRREGDRIVVPLGTFGARQEKTALMRMHVPAEREGIERVAAVSLRWRDLVARSDEAVEGALSLAVASPEDAQTDLDPFVGARLERSRTARTLTDANELFRQGKDDEARKTLANHVGELRAAEARAHSAAKTLPSPKPRESPTLDRDFADQINAIATAQSGFAEPPARRAGGPTGLSGSGAGGGGLVAGAPAAAPAPPPAPLHESREGKKAVKDNQAKAMELAF